MNYCPKLIPSKLQARSFVLEGSNFEVLCSADELRLAIVVDIAEGECADVVTFKAFPKGPLPLSYMLGLQGADV